MTTLGDYSHPHPHLVWDQSPCFAFHHQSKYLLKRITPERYGMTFRCFVIQVYWTCQQSGPGDLEETCGQPGLSRPFQHTFFKSRLYCRFWNFTKSARSCARSRTLPPIGNFTLPWRHRRYSVVYSSIAGHGGLVNRGNAWTLLRKVLLDINSAGFTNLTQSLGNRPRAIPTYFLSLQ